MTARAGADALAAGGNAVDACVAAAFASWVAESPLTGPGGGGFLLVHRARDRSTQVLDFFVAEPGIGRQRGSEAAMDEIVVDFGDSGSQVFRIGAGSCAVPGVLAGLWTAHRRFGRLPWAELAEPAAALARRGVELTPEQAFLHEILEPVLGHTPEGRRMFGRPRTGELLVLPDLAALLDLVARDGAPALYGGELGHALVDHVPGITLDDLRAYRVVRRRPVRVVYRGHEVLSNPPPSSGGILVCYGLALLDALGRADGEALVAVMREQARTRSDARFRRGLVRGGLGARLLEPASVQGGLRRLRGRQAPAEPPPLAGTTHISVVDAAGNAASLSASTGSGSGVVVPGTGLYMNNMLGEADLAGGPRSPGARMTSMMAPTLVLAPDGRPRLVVGSAGSARLRGAIMQIVVNAVARDLPVREAIERPRLHVEPDAVHLEGGFEEADAARLAACGEPLVCWRGRNLYFGGAAAVELRDGRLAAAGDPRRGGAGVVV